MSYPPSDLDIESVSSLLLSRYEKSLAERHDQHYGEPHTTPDEKSVVKNKLPTLLKLTDDNVIKRFNAILGERPSDIELDICTEIFSKIHAISSKYPDVSNDADMIMDESDIWGIFGRRIRLAINEIAPIPPEYSPSALEAYAERGGDVDMLRQAMDTLLKKFENLKESSVNLPKPAFEEAVKIAWYEAGVRTHTLNEGQLAWLSERVSYATKNPSRRDDVLLVLANSAAKLCLNKGEMLHSTYTDIELTSFEKTMIENIKPKNSLLSLAQAELVVNAVQARYPSRDLSPLIDVLTRLESKNDIMDAFELFWEKPEDMLNSRHGVVKHYSENSDEEKIEVEIRGDEYSFSKVDMSDCEGRFSSLLWQKNDILHRFGGPASDETRLHNIPSETYLDKAEVTYAINGDSYRVEDLTYERISRHKMPSDIAHKIDNNEALTDDDEARLGRLQLM